MLQALEQFAVEGLLEARSFLAVLLEAKAYTDIKVLPAPSVPADGPRVASVTQKLQEATKERNERRHKAQALELAYEAVVKTSCEVAAAIEAGEAATQKLRESQAAIVLRWTRSAQRNG